MVATMYEAGGLKVVAVCDGPDASGACAAVTLGEVVACAGLEVSVSTGEERPAGRRFRVPISFRLCPLTASGLFAAGYAYFSPFEPNGL